MLVSTSITWIKWTENIYCIWEFSKYSGIVKASVIVYLCVCKCVGAKRWQCSYDIVLCAILVSFGFITHSDDVDWHGSWCIIIAFIYSYTFAFPNFQRRAYIFEWLRHLQLTTVHEERATKKIRKKERKTEHQIPIATIKHFRSTSKATHTSAKCKAYIKSTRTKCYICSCNHEYYHSQSRYLMVWHTGAQEIKLIEHPYFRFQHLNLEVCTS